MKIHRPCRPVREDSGVALLLALIAAMAVLAAASIVALQMNTAKHRTDMSISQVELDEAAKAGLDAGIERFWNGFFSQLQMGEESSLANYMIYLDGIVANNPEGLNELVTVPGLQFPLDLRTGNAVVQTVSVDRVDDATGTSLTIRSLARSGNTQRAASQTIRIGGSLFEGFEFAILANNINCLLCHAEIRNALLEWNNDPATRPTGDSDGNGIQDWIDNLNTFERVKVASLESLMVRPDEADSHVAGAVYSGGRTYDDNGNELAGLSSTDFKGFEFGSDGKLIQSGSGNMFENDLVQAQVIDGVLDPWANLYLEDQTLDMIPDTFPAPYQDDGNRLVDDSEFDVVMDEAEGVISGGIIYGVPEGSAYTDSTLPTTGNLAGIAGSYDGNLILVGTESNPIIIDGDVAINGDLVLQGVVQGYGKLLTRSNVYITGDVTYADNSSQGPDGALFGQHLNDDGTSTENLLGVIAGGSILMGDYLTIRGKNKESNSSKYPNKKYSIDVREETLTDTWGGETMYIGYFDPGAVDAGEIQETMILADGTEVPRDGQQFSFTTSELMLFNELELTKALEMAASGEDYTARLYGLRESQPGNVYIYDYGDEHAVRYDEGGDGARVKTLTDWASSLTTGNSDYSAAEIVLLNQIISEATVHYMNPNGNWLSEDTLRQIWYDDEMARTSEQAFKFDGLLYSNNAIFSIIKSNGRHNSNTYGKMTLRGGIVAPDLGMFVPGGLNLLYDKRVKNLFNLEDTGNIQLTRLIFRYIDPATVTLAQGM